MSKTGKRRLGIRIPGITAMARACGVSHAHLRYVILGIRKPGAALKAKMEAYEAKNSARGKNKKNKPANMVVDK